MKKRLLQALVVAAVLLAAAQLIRPDFSSPTGDTSRSIQAQPGTPSGLAAVLDRSCGDCHSNKAVGGWYTNVAPASWLMASAIREGRKVINFSEWTTYSPERRLQLLAQSCDSVSAGRMPGAYTYVRSDTSLSTRDIDTICAASRSVAAHTRNDR
jgi:hypothetical protein